MIVKIRTNLFAQLNVKQNITSSRMKEKFVINFFFRVVIKNIITNKRSFIIIVATIINIKNARSIKRIRTQYVLNRFSFHVQQRLKRNKKCFKYLKKNHLITNKNVLCKKKNSINNNESILKFVVLKIE